MEALTAITAAATISATLPYMFRGAKLTAVAADTAQIQDGAGREIARLETVAASPSDVLMLPSPIPITGLIVVGLAGAGTLNIYVE